MTFDEVVEIIWGNTLGVDASDEPGKKDFIIKDDMVATGREALTYLINELKDSYAPTIEMTKNQYLFITSEYEKESVVDAVANLTADNIIKEEFHSNFWSPLSEKQVVQAWLHPNDILIVDKE